MKVVEIKKRGGGIRTLYVPSAAEKARMNALIGILTEKYLDIRRHGVVHGFVRQRSPVTNALMHVGYAYTLCVDLKDFFDNVTVERVSRALGLSTWPKAWNVLFVEGAARQGLPLSPLLSNIAATPLDRALYTYCQPRRIMYTRYADDLAFSVNDAATLKKMQAAIPSIVEGFFPMNHSKTRVLRASAGRRIICGVAVDNDGIYPTRKLKRRLRAARHNGWKRKARGLQEWCRLKTPHGYEFTIRQDSKGLFGVPAFEDMRKLEERHEANPSDV